MGITNGFKGVSLQGESLCSLLQVQHCLVTDTEGVWISGWCVYLLVTTLV